MDKCAQGPRLLMRNLRKAGAGDEHPSRGKVESMSRVRSSMRLELFAMTPIAPVTVAWLVVDNIREAITEIFDCLDRSKTVLRRFSQHDLAASTGTSVHSVPSPKITCLQR